MELNISGLSIECFVSGALCTSIVVDQLYFVCDGVLVRFYISTTTSAISQFLCFLIFRIMLNFLAMHCITCKSVYENSISENLMNVLHTIFSRSTKRKQL